jgi:hypothetical protein
MPSDVPERAAFEVDVSGCGPLSAAATLRAGDHFTFVTNYGDLDGLTVAVASLDDLIAMKQAAGRPKDRIEVEVLGALRDVIAEG